MEGLSICVLNHNEQEVTERCVEAIYMQNSPDFHNWEIIIVDNGSTDGSAEAAQKRFPIVEILKADNKDGFITGLNFTFSRAKYENVFFVSNDVFLKEDCIKEMLKVLQLFPKAVIQPVFEWPNGKIQNAGMDWKWPGYGYACQKIMSEGDYYSPDIVTTTALMMKKDTFLSIGDFDVKYRPAHYEDVDYSMRAREKRHPLLVCNKARTEHLASHTISKQDGKHGTSDRCHRNRLYLVRKHYKGFDQFLRVVTIHILDFFGRLLRMR